MNVEDPRSCESKQAGDAIFGRSSYNTRLDVSEETAVILNFDSWILFSILRPIQECHQLDLNSTLPKRFFQLISRSLARRRLCRHKPRVEEKN